MIKLKKEKVEIYNTINMENMQPLQIAVIIDKDNESNGHYILRTASVENFEVMDITSPGGNACWLTRNNMQVKLLGPNDELHIILSNPEIKEIL